MILQAHVSLATQFGLASRFCQAMTKFIQIAIFLFFAFLASPVLDAQDYSTSIVDTDFDIITEQDPSCFVGLAYQGMQKAEMPDKTSDADLFQDAYIFETRYSDENTIQIAIDSRFESEEMAEQESLRYATRLGQLPHALRSGVRRVVVHKGRENTTAFSDVGLIVLYSANATKRIETKDLEETLFHEAVHAAWDHKYAKSADWKRAQASDGTFATLYAKKKPELEDLAESALFAFAVIHHVDRIPAEDAQRIRRAIPARIQFIERLLPISKTMASVRPPAGRLAIVADGNSPDPDDIGATAVIFGLLHASKLNDRLVHLSHSCDLKPSDRISAADELRRQEVMNEVCVNGIKKYGPFPKLASYFNCRTDQKAAVDDLCAAINMSSDTNPLWIIEAGEPDIIGYALQAANAEKRKYVNVVSHHPANDNAGDFFSWQQILDFGVTEHQIGDQNVGLKTPIPPWDWAKRHADERIRWIWERLAYAERDGVVKFQTGYFDCSDAGMVYWWTTGAAQGGNQHATPSEIKAMLLSESSPR